MPTGSVTVAKAISVNGIAENVAPVNSEVEPPAAGPPPASGVPRRPRGSAAASATRTSAAHTGPTSGAAIRMNSHTAPQTAPR